MAEPDAVKEIKKGDKITLYFKQGANNAQGQPTIIAKSPCGRIALLHFSTPTSKQVTDNSTWECIVEYTFPKKIVVRPVKEVVETPATEEFETTKK